MLRPARFFFYFLLILFAAAKAEAAPQTLSERQLAKLLNETDSLRQQLVYTGTVDLFSGVDPEASKRLRVWRVRNEYYHQEEVPYPDKEEKKKQKKRRRYYFPSLPSEKYLSLLLSNYTVTIEPSEMVAKRETRCLSFMPKNLPRFGIKIWLDRQTSHILKREIWYITDSGSSLVMLMKYETIAYNRMPPDSLWSQRDRDRRNRNESPPRREPVSFQSFEELVRNVEVPIWTPGYLPVGVELVSIKYFEEKERKIVHYHYTDGILSLSIFQIYGKPPASVVRLLKEPPTQRPVPEFRKVFAARKQNHYFLIIGNFPLSELKKISNSMKPMD